MSERERLRKLKSRRVVHESTGRVLPRNPEPVDPVGNAPPTDSFLNTVAHPHPLPITGEGIGTEAYSGCGDSQTRSKRVGRIGLIT
jgi:hypothetical protein